MSAHAPVHNPTIRHSLPTLSRLAPRLAKLVVAWKLRQRSRHDLAMLDAHMLSDIGVDPLTADIEAHKPFWRA